LPLDMITVSIRT